MKKEIVLITGANGMVARRLSSVLAERYTLRFLTREPLASNEFLWDIDKRYVAAEALEGVNHLIHLAGVSVAQKRWSRKQKQKICDSRVQSAALLLQCLKERGVMLQTFISASAVGYYGTQTTERIFTETDPHGADFLSDVCVQWEQAAEAFEAVSRRVVIMRLGTVLSGEAGALPQMAATVRYGFGAALATGKQYVTWVDVDDVCRFVQFALSTDISGAFNVVASEAVTNAELMKAIANALQQKLWLPNVPAYIIRCMFGEMAVLLLEGSRVSNEKTKAAGFAFRYESLSEALQKALSK
ncbi:TIGR01777 family oxidoreductase [Capnocytophaga sp.]|uniref:TIGR01777 family oxidoreductase n=1 Tax=Capnocytophaga sp. TaxID=44737 RepID=UPI0026DCAA92|nr:TIGR01777 family oxidoreductase [Capnocytophaga sp.]MDO5105567.1 TIGR01777 family oxidoreductase [Capnocytophaga sp.]